MERIDLDRYKTPYRPDRNGNVYVLTVDQWRDVALSWIDERSPRNTWRVNWAGNRAETKAGLQQAGSVDWAKRTQALIDQIKLATPPMLGAAFRVQQTVEPWAINTPAVLAGDPEFCLQTVPVFSDVAPLSMFVQLNADAQCSLAQLEQRNAAALALYQVVSAVRPVTLYGVISNLRRRQRGQHKKGEHRTVIFDCGRTFSLARMGHLIGDPGMFRGLWFCTGLAESVDASGEPTVAGRSRSQAFERIIPDYLKQGGGVYLPRLESSDSILTNPEGWVESMANTLLQRIEA